MRGAGVWGDGSGRLELSDFGTCTHEFYSPLKVWWKGNLARLLTLLALTALPVQKMPAPGY